jgi:hypothetical protein
MNNYKKIEFFLYIHSRNVFDIPRNQMLDPVMKLRRHLSQKDNVNHPLLQDDDALHSVPIKEVSNYDEYPRANGQAPPLRDIDAQPVRQHVFGNPCKVNKVNRREKKSFCGKLEYSSIVVHR